MNHCLLMAEIVSAPQLRYTQDNQTAISEMTIVFPGLRPEDEVQKLKVVGWGNLAQEIQERYQTGDLVLIEGRLTINSVDRPEGFKETQAELTAQRIHRLADLGALNIPQPTVPVTTAGDPVAAAPYSGAAAQPEPTQATDSEVDYDDIPF